MEADAERTLNNLHVLSVLSHNDKLMTNEDVFDIYSPTTFRGLMRMWYGERRLQNVQRIRCTVRAAMTFASRTLDDANALTSVQPRTDNMTLRIDTIVLQHVRMVDGLARAKEGLANLQQTYRDDPALTSQLSLVVEEIGAFLNVITAHTRKLQAQTSPMGAGSPLSLPLAESS